MLRVARPALHRVRALAAAATIVGATAVAPAGAGASDGFYVPPDPLPAGPPGELLRSEPTRPKLPAFGRSPAGGAWKVLYRSTTAGGDATAVSGTVIVPRGRPRAIIGVGPGTQGMADRCASSRLLPQGLHYEAYLVAQLLSRGWAVAMTDYEGLGTPGEHPYIVGRSAGHTVLDVVRAARGLPEAGLADVADTGLFGYSQGGGAVGWAAELQPSYAPDIPLTGVVAGGVPADLRAVETYLDAGPFTGLNIMGTAGLEVAYPELDVRTHFNRRGQDMVRRSLSTCLADALLAFPFLRLSSVGVDDPVTSAQWHARMDENLLGRAKPAAPILLMHAVRDEAIPRRQARTLRAEWCARDVAVRWQGLPGEHAIGVVAAVAPGARWLAERFRGTPEAGDCGA